GRLRAMLYAQQAVVEENYRDDGASLLQIRQPKSDLLRILSAASLAFEDLTWDDQTLPVPDDLSGEL
ncbi:MAG TPA: GTPase HflX, partial [Cellvibrio sp.]